jgi:hypothetical protein
LSGTIRQHPSLWPRFGHAEFGFVPPRAVGYRGSTMPVSWENCPLGVQTPAPPLWVAICFNPLTCGLAFVLVALSERWLWAP